MILPLTADYFKSIQRIIKFLLSEQRLSLMKEFELLFAKGRWPIRSVMQKQE